MAEARLASEVILDLEQKINALLNMVRTLDLNIKVISNKLNTIQYVPEQKQEQPMFTASLPDEIQPNKQIIIEAEDPNLIEKNPVGFRRTSRPETYVGQQPKQPSKQEFVEPEIIVPNPVQVNQTNARTQGAVPIMQRVVDKNNKTLLLANVEIIDQATGTQVYKTRTNGSGKWMASLPIGKYKVLISKLESLTKQRVSSTQDLVIDGSINPLELPVLTIK